MSVIVVTQRYAHLAPGLVSGARWACLREIKEQPGLVEDAAAAYVPEGPLRIAAQGASRFLVCGKTAQSGAGSCSRA